MAVSLTPAAVTATAPPTEIPTITATAMQPVPTVVPPFGNADQIAILAGNDIYLINPDGTGLTLVRTDNAAKSNMHWIPGRKLIYLSRNCAYMLDGETKVTQEIVCFPVNELLEDFHVSRDGKFVAISVQRTLNILPFDMEALKNVTTRYST